MLYCAKPCFSYYRKIYCTLLKLSNINIFHIQQLGLFFTPCLCIHYLFHEISISDTHRKCQQECLLQTAKILVLQFWYWTFIRSHFSILTCTQINRGRWFLLLITIFNGKGQKETQVKGRGNVSIEPTYKEKVCSEKISNNTDRQEMEMPRAKQEKLLYLWLCYIFSFP